MYTLKDALTWAKNHAKAKDTAYSMIKSIAIGDAILVKTKFGYSQVLRTSTNRYEIFV